MDVERIGSTSMMNGFYYTGGMRVAMRTGSSTLNFLLGDHLGSTAITTSSSGGKLVETRYYPWGTERYSFGLGATPQLLDPQGHKGAHQPLREVGLC